MSKHLIAWDFDGVLNANIVDGRFVWADDVEADWGVDKSAMVDHLFGSGLIHRIVRGQLDLRVALGDWLHVSHPQVDADAFLAYWFAKDARPDPNVVAWLNNHSARHVIATNNEARRATYIESEMGFGALVERVFASGRMGVAKPDAAYFAAIEQWSGYAPQHHVLIDDTRPNVDAARARGWSAFHFTDQSRDGLAAFLEDFA